MCNIEYRDASMSQIWSVWAYLYKYSQKHVLHPNIFTIAIRFHILDISGAKKKVCYYVGRGGGACGTYLARGLEVYDRYQSLLLWPQ